MSPSSICSFGRTWLCGWSLRDKTSKRGRKRHETTLPGFPSRVLFEASQTHLVRLDSLYFSRPLRPDSGCRDLLCVGVSIEDRFLRRCVGHDRHVRSQLDGFSEWVDA
jgi:hypothetical protein